MSSVSDRLNRNTTTWRPEKGDTLAGEIIEIGSFENEHGVSPVLTVLDDAGDEFSWIVFGTVAQGAIARHRPKVGDNIGVKYLGIPEGRKYHNWKIVVEHVTPETPVELDWDAMAQQADADAEIDAGLRYEPGEKPIDNFDTSEEMF